MPADPVPDFTELLATLQVHQVEFLVVGGVCAVLHGAPVSTFDIDIVHRRTPENVARLVRALHEVQAFYREHPDRRPMPTTSALLGEGHHLLLTRYGPLDVLGAVVDGRDYDGLVEHSEEMALPGSSTFRVLDLETLILLKERLARDRDKAVIPILRRTLEEKRKAEGQGA